MGSGNLAKKINYVPGDLFAGIKEASKTKKIVVPHVCNDMGAFGSGFAGAVARFYPEVQKEYFKWSQDKETTPFELGEIQMVSVDTNITFVNMIGQHKMIAPNYIPVRYSAIAACLEKVLAAFVDYDNLEVHCPKFGAGLAGGRWVVIEALIQEILVDNGIPVTVYEMTQEEMKERMVYSIVRNPKILDDLIKSFGEEAVDWTQFTSFRFAVYLV